MSERRAMIVSGIVCIGIGLAAYFSPLVGLTEKGPTVAVWLVVGALLTSCGHLFIALGARQKGLWILCTVCVLLCVLPAFFIVLTEIVNPIGEPGLFYMGYIGSVFCGFPLSALLSLVAIFWALGDRGQMPPGYCQKCKYNLTGLRDPRCPECGTPFDPSVLPEVTEPKKAHGDSPNNPS